MLSEPGIYALAMVAAVCVGLSKSGFSGISLISVLLFAEIYGAKTSVGLALPLLIAADLLAYPAFRNHGSWKPVWKLLPPALVGLAFGWLLLDKIDDRLAARWIGACVLSMVALQVFRKLRPVLFERIGESREFGFGAGVLGGFATMLANAAGPVIQLYLLGRRIPKMELIGIGARFFLVINLLKVPLNAKLALINQESLMDNAKLLPGVIAGVYGGRWLIRHVPQAAFEWMIVGFATLAGVRLMFL